MRFVTIIAIIILFQTSIISAQTFEYLGLANKNITSLDVNYNLLAVGTDSGGVYWQQEWEADSSKWNNIPLNQTINTVYPHKSGPIGWAISAGIMKNECDSGLIFCSYMGKSFKSNSIGIVDSNSYGVFALDGFPDPTICGETYAVTGDALYRRNFGDTTWSKINEAWEGSFQTVNTKIKYPGIVMLGGSVGFTGILLAMSTDFGDSWRDISPLGAVCDIDFTGDSAEVIFAAAYSDVFKTTDNGNTWDKIFRNDQQFIFNNILYDDYSNTLFVSGFEGGWHPDKPVLLFSNDMGDTWNSIELNFADEIMDLEYSSDGGHWIYFATRNKGVFRFDMSLVSAEEEADESVKQFRLYNNYPNPFNPTTTIKYTIPVVDENFSSTTNVKLLIYDILGREVATLINGYQSAGTHEVKFDGINLSSGIYYYKLSYGSISVTRKMLLMK